LDLGYNLDHVGALAAFQEAIQSEPDDPAAYRLAAAATWIAHLFQQGDITVDDYLGQARRDTPRKAEKLALDTAFHTYLRSALNLAERRLAADPTDIDARYQVGAALGFVASHMATIEGRLLAGLGPARRAYREHERVLKLDPRRKDAGLIVGMYRYAVASLPAPARVMARLAGFKGSREIGLRMIEEAARYPSDAQPNALFTLVLLYNREARYEEAIGVIEELQARYPRNRLLWLEAGNTALRAGRPLYARTALEEGLNRFLEDARPRAAGEEARWRYGLGAALVALRETDKAEQELRLAADQATREWVRGRAHAELGKLADLAGNRPAAIECYRVAKQLCDRDGDTECSKQAGGLSKTPYR
jgi:tetratricopeptide (TPR) repeat protein